MFENSYDLCAGVYVWGSLALAFFLSLSFFLSKRVIVDDFAVDSFITEIMPCGIHFRCTDDDCCPTFCVALWEYCQELYS